MSKNEAKQLLERLIFESDRPQDWVQDVWGLSPTLGEDAAKLVDVFDMLIECCSDDKLENLVKSLYQEHMDL
jgi:hypothetical protein